MHKTVNKKMLRIRWLLEQIAGGSVELSEKGEFVVPRWCILHAKELLKYEGRFDTCYPPCMTDAPMGGSNKHGQPWGG